MRQSKTLEMMQSRRRAALLQRVNAPVASCLMEACSRARAAPPLPVAGGASRSRSVSLYTSRYDAASS